MTAEPQVLEITEDLKEMLHACDYNWFKFIENLPSLKRHDFSSMPAQLVVDSFS